MNEEGLSAHRLLELEQKNARSRMKSRILSISLAIITVLGIAFTSFAISQRNSKLERILAENALLETERSHLEMEMVELRDKEIKPARLISSGRYEEAKALLEVQLQEQERTLGPSQPEIIPILNELARIEEASGQDEASAILYQRGFKIAEKSYGINHAATLGAMVNLASARLATGDFVEAEQLYSEAYKISLKALGSDSLQVARIQAGLERSRDAQDTNEYKIIMLPGRVGRPTALSPDGRIIAVVSIDNIHLINAITGQSILPNLKINHVIGHPSLVQFFPSGNEIAVISTRGDIHVIDLSTGENIMTYIGKGLKYFNISPDGKAIYLTDYRNKIVKINALNGKVIFINEL